MTHASCFIRSLGDRLADLVRAHGGVVLLYAAVTVAWTWPLVTHVGGVVPHDLGDPLMSIWLLWWNARELAFTGEWWNGAFFHPAEGVLAFSDHRVGISLLTTPLIWLGATPLAAYAVAFAASFWLSASTAYALCFTVTSNRAVAFVGGLVFGFNPYRAGHLAHIELLAAYWLPVILLALHRWVDTRQTGWLIVFGAALLLQALTGGYYFVFVLVLLALWLAWFFRGGRAADPIWLGATIGVVLLAVAPILLRYHAVHQEMGLRRTMAEIHLHSADVAGLLTAPPLLAVWPSPRRRKVC